VQGLHGRRQGLKACGVGLEQQLHLLRLLESALPAIERPLGLQGHTGHQPALQQRLGQGLRQGGTALGGQGHHQLPIAAGRRPIRRDGS